MRSREGAAWKHSLGFRMKTSISKRGGWQVYRLGELRRNSTFSRNELRLQLFLVAFMLLYYGALITNGTFNFLQPTPYWVGLTFNSMLEHLLHGHFDVDPEAVGSEGFLRDGRVYAYWGIFCAVIRLPLLTF